MADTLLLDSNARTAGCPDGLVSRQGSTAIRLSERHGRAPHTGAVQYSIVIEPR